MKKVRKEFLKYLIVRDNSRNFNHATRVHFNIKNFIPIKCESYTVGDVKAHPHFENALILNLYFGPDLWPIPENFNFVLRGPLSPRVEAWIL